MGFLGDFFTAIKEDWDSKKERPAASQNAGGNGSNAGQLRRNLCAVHDFRPGNFLEGFVICRTCGHEEFDPPLSPALPRVPLVSWQRKRKDDWIEEMETEAAVREAGWCSSEVDDSFDEGLPDHGRDDLPSADDLGHDIEDHDPYGYLD